ncbi:hypothetical protein [Duganella sp. Leaf126]|uniref:hypothetical protein n=1 Tax=Duganella sp. Leaf126 TaxID=1736266 RepID=UPI0012E2B831|nr:hypothetical protein [Duganella sp. Leaf126]
MLFLDSGIGTARLFSLSGQDRRFKARVPLRSSPATALKQGKQGSAPDSAIVTGNNITIAVQQR